MNPDPGSSDRMTDIRDRLSRIEANQERMVREGTTLQIEGFARLARVEDMLKNQLPDLKTVIGLMDVRLTGLTATITGENGLSARVSKLESNLAKFTWKNLLFYTAGVAGVMLTGITILRLMHLLG